MAGYKSVRTATQGTTIKKPGVQINFFLVLLSIFHRHWLSLLATPMLKGTAKQWKVKGKKN